MLLASLRWLGHNIGTLVLAFVLAVVVWVSAVVTSDPNVEQIYPRAVPLAKVGKDSGLVMMGDVPAQVRVTLNAPRSIWTQLNNNPNSVEAWIDLTGLGAGEHTLDVKARVVGPSPVQIVSKDPQTVRFVLEPLVTRQFPVRLVLNGEPPLGYKRGEIQVTPNTVTVSGPQSLVDKIAELHVTMDISGAREPKVATLPIEAVDENGAVLNDPNLSVSPKMISVSVPVSLEGGYKNVVVRVITTGKPEEGYRLTNISVTPLNVTVFSTNPQLINQMPGYVETTPVDLNGLNDDIDVRVSLVLPDRVSLVGDPSVLVQVGVAANEGSRTISILVEKLGMAPDLQAKISPPTIDIIVSGPMPVLDKLTTASFRAVVNLGNMAPGVYQIEPKVDLVPDQVQVVAIIPETVEVTIEPAPTPLPTSGTPGTPAPSATPRP